MRGPSARPLYAASGIVLAVLPVAMAVANRSSPVVVGVAAALALLASLAEAGARATARRLAAPLATPVGLTALAFLAWALVSLAWAPLPAVSLRALGEFAPALVGAYVLARLLPEHLSRRLLAVAAACLALACLVILVGLASDLWLQRRLGGRVALFVFNRPAITAALLLFPLAAALALGLGRRGSLLPLAERGWGWGSGRGSAALGDGAGPPDDPARVPTPIRAGLPAGPLSPQGGRQEKHLSLRAVAPVIGLVGIVLLAVLRSVSGAAALGLAAGALAALAAALLPRRGAAGLVALALAAALALAPVEGDLLAAAMPDALHQRLAASSSRVRVGIARSFGAAVAADPWRGAGFGTSAAFDRTPAAAALPPEMRLLTGVGHPHNVALQIWVELGLVGALLAAATLLLTLARLADLPRVSRCGGLGLLAAAAAIAYVEHAAWPAWWIATLGAAAAWLRLAARLERVADAGSEGTTG